MSRRTLIAVAGWLAAAVAATLIGLTAIRLVGESIVGTPDGVLSAQEVAAAVAALPSQPPPAPGPSVTVTTSARPTAGPDTGDRTFAVTGGTAVVSCAADDRAKLVTWTPARPGLERGRGRARPGPRRESRVHRPGRHVRAARPLRGRRPGPARLRARRRQR